MNEVQSRFGLSNTKASSLLSGLLSLLSRNRAAVSAASLRFRNAGLGDVVSSWFSGTTRNLTNDQVESVLGSGALTNLAFKAGISTTTAASAVALMLPRVMQSIAHRA
jgi:uncharacterized protein YidB (DUF937 family)